MDGWLGRARARLSAGLSAAGAEGHDGHDARSRVLSMLRKVHPLLHNIPTEDAQDTEAGWRDAGASATMQRASDRPLTPILGRPGLDSIDGDVGHGQKVWRRVSIKRISLFGAQRVSLPSGRCALGVSARPFGRIDGTLTRRAIRAARPVLICASFILTSSANLACREPRTTKDEKTTSAFSIPALSKGEGRTIVYEPRLQTDGKARQGVVVAGSRRADAASIWRCKLTTPKQEGAKESPWPHPWLRRRKICRRGCSMAPGDRVCECCGGGDWQW